MLSDPFIILVDISEAASYSGRINFHLQDEGMKRSGGYASFLRLAYEEIILRQYSRNLIFAVLDLNPLLLSRT